MFKIKERIYSLRTLSASLSLEKRERLQKRIFDAFTYNIETRLTFDYNRFICDPYYASYYKILIEEASKLSLFLPLGFRHNSYIKSLIIQDINSHYYPLELSDQELNIKGLTFMEEFFWRINHLDKIFFSGNGPR